MMLKFYMKDVKKCQAHEWGPVMENSDKSDMTLKQWNKSSETATNNTKMGWDYDSDEEKGKMVVKCWQGQCFLLSQWKDTFWNSGNAVSLAL